MPSVAQAPPIPTPESKPPTPTFVPPPTTQKPPAAPQAPPTLDQKIISLDQKPPAPAETQSSTSILSALDDPELEEALDNMDSQGKADHEASLKDLSADPMQLIRDSLSGKLDEGEKSE
jgi:hypothetical protein